jgi:hypothetical protein
MGGGGGGMNTCRLIASHDAQGAHIALASGTHAAGSADAAP